MRTCVNGAQIIEGCVQRLQTKYRAVLCCLQLVGWVRLAHVAMHFHMPAVLQTCKSGLRAYPVEHRGRLMRERCCATAYV